MKNKTFLLIFLGLSSTILVLVSAFNFIIDPGNIYYKKMLIENKEDQIFNIFSQSKHGINYQGNQRFLSLLFAKKMPSRDCVAMGSSRIMQLSTIRGKYIKKTCTSLLNLGVSGGSFEDILITLEALRISKSTHSKVIIGIDPWTLKTNMDKRYLLNSNLLDSFLSHNQLTLPKYTPNPITFNKLVNLLNLEYTVSSFETVKKDGLNFQVLEKLSAETLNLTPLKLSPLKGFPLVESKLKDGSHLHPKWYIAKKTTSKNYEKEPSYKLSGDYYNEDIIDLLKKIILKLKQNQDVILILIPYHHNVFKNKFLKYTNYLNNVETRLIKMAQDINVKVLGSYSPSVSKCTDNEFYDYMHPKSSCIDKLFEGHDSN